MAQGAVVLERERDRPARGHGRARSRLELPALRRFGPGEVTLESRVNGDLPPPDAPLENGNELESQGAVAERRLRGLELEAQPELHREPPRLRCADARAHPPPGEVDPRRGAMGGEQISRKLPVVGETVGQLGGRSEEHTSELQSRLHLVCRLLLEKKKKKKRQNRIKKKHSTGD